MGRSANGPVSMLQVAEDILPIGELKAHLSEKIGELRARRCSFIVTQNGKAAAGHASEEFDRLTSQRDSSPPSTKGSTISSRDASWITKSWVATSMPASAP